MFEDEASKELRAADQGLIRDNQLMGYLKEGVRHTKEM